MKTTKILKVIALLCSVALTSCNDFLEEDPKGSVSEIYAETEEGAEKQLLSLYQINNSLLEPMYMIGELGSDCIGYGGNVGTRLYWKAAVRYEDQYLQNTEENGGLWKWLYVALATVNTSISSIEKASFSNESNREKLLAEAYALRAYYLLYLTETFGPAAYYSENHVENTSQIDGSQPGLSTFYKRIFADLDYAKNHLPMPSIVRSSQFGRMDLGIAKSIEMRAYMALASKADSVISAAGAGNAANCYAKTIELCKSIRNDYGYQLESNYEDIFKPENQKSNEIIWSVQYGNSIYNSKGDLIGGNHMHRYWTPQYNKTAYVSSIPGLPSHSIFYGREYRACIPTYYFITNFSKYDKRRDATFFSAYCRFPNGNGSLAPDLNDTLLVRSLDILTAEQKESYTSRGIYCDDLTDLYDVSTGKLKNNNVRSFANTMKKWHDPSRETMKQEFAYRDAITIRLGEIYLTEAEAYVRQGNNEEAAKLITELRQRDLMPGHENELAVRASDMTMDFIRNEYARELGAEMWNKYMVKRTLQPEEWAKWIASHNPDACEISDGGVKAYHYWRPVPQSVLDSYEALGIPFKQNEGYK
ncbi:MAG: RagB/SusD family nutrient uptake outer membrane protein [Bacteroidaceae bacterium]|nr:RagB/SusD family nutrient uptake outer membrane protein [Bacteroidaceae bacterium]MBP3211543.1 RagB/SusD family nutrient uptake outer membrane protein [Prevotella sp.]